MKGSGPARAERVGSPAPGDERWARATRSSGTGPPGRGRTRRSPRAEAQGRCIGPCRCLHEQGGARPRRVRSSARARSRGSGAPLTRQDIGRTPGPLHGEVVLGRGVRPRTTRHHGRHGPHPWRPQRTARVLCSDVDERDLTERTLERRVIHRGRYLTVRIDTVAGRRRVASTRARSSSIPAPSSSWPLDGEAAAAWCVSTGRRWAGCSWSCLPGRSSADRTGRSRSRSSRPPARAGRGDRPPRREHGGTWASFWTAPGLRRRAHAPVPRDRSRADRGLRAGPERTSASRVERLPWREAVALAADGRDRGRQVARRPAVAGAPGRSTASSPGSPGLGREPVASGRRGARRGLGVTPGMRPRLAIGAPSISLRSPVKSMGVAPLM